MTPTQLFYFSNKKKEKKKVKQELQPEKHMRLIPENPTTGLL